MSIEFDPGAVGPPFKELVEDYPGAEVYPQQSFRVEWGPIFHRGRLDGTARLLVLGQDPAASETVVRRILVGEAGHRVQGLLAKLGMARSYLMINTFLYSVYGQRGGEEHVADRGIVAYRQRWLDAAFEANELEAVLALGHLANTAWEAWRATPNGQAQDVAFAHVIHPTQPDATARGDDAAYRAAVAAMLANWNAALDKVHAHVAHPDSQRPLVLYGETFAPGDRAAIPAADFPAGLPEWMRAPRAWATRTGATAELKRRTIAITAPELAT